MNTFPTSNNPIGIIGGGVAVFTNPACTVRAQLFDMTGKALLGNVLTIPDSGRIPEFQANASVLYVRAANGEVVTWSANPVRTAPTVTGSKGGNAALTSLMAALSAEGIVNDQTT